MTDFNQDREGLTHKVTIGGVRGFITANRNDDGELTEVFVHGFGAYGSTMQGWTDSFGILLSIGLRSGALDIGELARRFAHLRFDPYGDTDNPAIPRCHSIPDYIFRWLVHHFGPNEMRAELAAIDQEMKRD